MSLISKIVLYLAKLPAAIETDTVDEYLQDIRDDIFNNT